MAAKILPIETLQRLFRYEPETGNVYWVAEGKGRIKKKAAGTVVKAGYIGIMIDGKRYYAHRIAWALHHGKHPIDQLDHINGIKTDNRIVNLRQASNLQNGKNIKTKRNNTSGYSGVVFCKQTGKWRVMIKVNSKSIHFGRYKNLYDAVAIRKKAEIQYFGEWRRHDENLR